MNNLTIPAQPGDALINAQACFPDLQWLQKEFDVLYFLDFCAGLEAVILHNTLYTIGSLPSHRNNPIIAPLLKTKILQFYELATPKPLETAQEVLGHQRSRNIMSLLYNANVESKFFTRIAANALSMIMDFVLEDKLEVPLVHSTQSLPIYLLLPDVQAEQKALNSFYGALAQKYSDYKDVLFALKAKADRKDVIRIPPIALEALSRSKDFEELGDVIMELRDKYHKVREQFAELDHIMRSDDQPMKKKLKAQAKLEKSISKLFTTDELDGMTVFTSFARGLNESVELSDVIKDPEITDISWSKLIGHLLDKGEALFWKFRLSPLHSTKKRYFNLSNKQISCVVKRHFGHELTEVDVSLSQEYWQEIERLKSAFGNKNTIKS